ncbi:MAG: sensor histidine kinase [Lysobacter sp.]
MWNRVLNWLRGAPIADAVDRRNAPAMQVLLLFYGLALPANWAWHLSSRPIPQGWTIVLLLDLATSLLALACVAMIRHGRFRPAIKLFLGALLASLALAFHKLGAQAQLIDQTALILTLAIAGLVLGRQALWVVFVLLMLVFAIGFATDSLNVSRSEQWIANALRNAPSLLLSYLIITVILDRTITALRESLAESNARGRELQREMAERERTQSQLIHSQKMEVSGRLASGVAHDFNNILDVIIGFARQRHALRDGGGVGEQAAALDDALDGVELAAHRGTAITRKLLNFSRAEVLKIEVFDAGQALAELQPMLRQLFPPTVRFDLQAGPGPAPVRLDRSGFELMVLNIAANARDAMPDGGSFQVRMAHAAHDRVEITLTDSGHGMDEQVRQRIFEPFFSTKSAAEGTGLGLAVIRDLVKVAGGEIDVASVVGEGSEFRIRLPVVASTAVARESRNDQVPSLST